MTAERFRPTQLEVASGLVYGRDGETEPLPPSSPCRSARSALERAIAEALRRPPCVISFSGGRDSSAVLALAVQVARREGLAPPVPVTLRFPDAPRTDEADWQEAVIRHLGLDDWERLSFTNELDTLGPYAERSMRRHGLLWPFNRHFHMPVLDLVPGGTLMTGIGGDELFVPSQWSRVVRILSARIRPRRRDLPTIGLALLPVPLRVPVVRNFQKDFDLPWLRPPSMASVREQRARDASRKPVSWERALRTTWWCSRYRLAARWSMEVLAADTATQVAYPLEDPGFLVALAQELGRFGFGSRTQAMQYLFADVLPADVRRRSSKANFDDAFRSDHTRDFVRRWDGSGVDERVVDGERLRRAWSDDPPDARSFLLLKDAWLAGQGLPRSGELLQEPRGRVPEAGPRAGPPELERRQ